MENDNITSQSMSIGILSCILLVVGGVFFGIFFFDGIHFYSGQFSIVGYFPIFFIVFISIIAILSAKRRRQYLTASYKNKQINPPVKAQLPYKREVELSNPGKKLNIYCRYCGEFISKDSNYCPQCGTKLM
ncbi:MAG: zinc ribbon domain-containing protein [Promethearchaeota archaeon]